MPHFWSFVDGEFRKLTFVRVLIRSHTPGSDKYVYDKSYRVDGPLAVPLVARFLNCITSLLSPGFQHPISPHSDKLTDNIALD